MELIVRESKKIGVVCLGFILILLCYGCVKESKETESYKEKNISSRIEEEIDSSLSIVDVVTKERKHEDLFLKIENKFFFEEICDDGIVIEKVEIEEDGKIRSYKSEVLYIDSVIGYFREENGLYIYEKAGIMNKSIIVFDAEMNIVNKYDETIDLYENCKGYNAYSKKFIICEENLENLDNIQNGKIIEVSENEQEVICEYPLKVEQDKIILIDRCLYNTIDKSFFCGELADLNGRNDSEDIFVCITRSGEIQYKKVKNYSLVFSSGICFFDTYDEKTASLLGLIPSGVVDIYYYDGSEKHITLVNKYEKGLGIAKDGSVILTLYNEYGSKEFILRVYDVDSNELLTEKKLYIEEAGCEDIGLSEPKCVIFEEYREIIMYVDGKMNVVKY